MIRGGAIGDFLLTLPAIQLLNSGLPDNHLEILGYRSVAGIAVAGGLASATRSIEHGPMAGFFVPDGELNREWSDYLTSFDIVISYLYDPDEYFHGNLERIGVKTLLRGVPKIDPSGKHALDQLAEVLTQLGLFLDDDSRAVSLSYQGNLIDQAREFLRPSEGRPLLALHPGSGSPFKNWDLSNWKRFVAQMTDALPAATFVVATGEAEEDSLQQFLAELNNRKTPMIHADSLPLPLLGAVFSQCRAFVGHDSGIGHLAAVSGLSTTLLFGPTSPDIWAPPHSTVRTLEHSSGVMEGIKVDEVVENCLEMWAANK